MVIPLLWECIMWKVAIMEDGLYIVDVEKVVSSWRCTLWTGGLGIWQKYTLFPLLIPNYLLSPTLYILLKLILQYEYSLQFFKYFFLLLFLYQLLIFYNQLVQIFGYLCNILYKPPNNNGLVPRISAPLWLSKIPASPILPSLFFPSISISSGSIITPKNPTSLTFYLYFSSFTYKLFSSILLKTSSIDW